MNEKQSMASAESGNGPEMDDNDNCTIEASVVTGFEESARGEAKEKFSCEVKAARGRIQWKMPVANVKDVIKLGAIDNARVVVYNVPHFKFTEQYDSLSRLQKLVPEMNWALGLKVWQKYFDFPHVVASKPDVIPSPEELVDVVIMQRQQIHEKKTKKEGGKKAKKWGKGKGKKKDKGGKKSAEGGSGGDAENIRKMKEGDEIVIENDKDSKIMIDGQDSGDGLVSSVNNEHGVKEVSSGLEGVELKDDGSGGDKKDQSGVRESAAPGCPQCCAEAGDAPCEPDQMSHIPSPKTVIIKKADPNREEAKIEITILDGGLGPNAFPTDVEDQDQRDVEPMDIDQSMNKSILNVSQATLEPSEDIKDVSCAIKSYEGSAKTATESVSSSSAVNEFASSVIEKLNSPKSSPERDTSSLSVSPHKSLCTTPPSTPVASLDSINFSPSFSKTNNDSGLSSSNDTVTSADNKPTVNTDKNTIDSPVQCMNLKEKTDSIPSQPLLSMNDSEAALESTAGLAETEKLADTEKKSPVKKERDPTKPTFRVTCNRVGDCHDFDSASAAASLGSAIITYFEWSVDLKNHDIEVLLNIDNEEVTVALALTKTSLHNRNIVAFGPTTLRATICYNMLRLCRIKNGDFICDPMCGTSAIPVESAANWPNCYSFGGDFHEKAMENTRKNITSFQEKLQAEKKSTLKIDAVQWDIQHFPLRNKCVDVFVSDLPFGYRMGSRVVNRTLYPCLLSEMARTGRAGSRACLLTEDKTNLIKAIQTMSKMWQRRLILNINMGGLSAFVFLLTRTATAFAPITAAFVGRTDGSQPASEKDAPSPNGDVQLPGNVGQTASEKDDPAQNGNVQLPEMIGQTTADKDIATQIVNGQASEGEGHALSKRDVCSPDSAGAVPQQIDLNGSSDAPQIDSPVTNPANVSEMSSGQEKAS